MAKSSFWDDLGNTLTRKAKLKFQGRRISMRSRRSVTSSLHRSV